MYLLLTHVERVIIKTVIDNVKLALKSAKPVFRPVHAVLALKDITSMVMTVLRP